jgi:hypothetical protein
LGEEYKQLPTVWSTIFLKNLIFAKLDKKFPIFYGKLGYTTSCLWFPYAIEASNSVITSLNETWMAQ